MSIKWQRFRALCAAPVTRGGASSKAREQWLLLHLLPDWYALHNLVHFRSATSPSELC